MSSTRTDIIIIGAGLTGLSLGYYLEKAGKNFIILEREAKPGGVISTGVEKGFIFEKGPSTGVLSTPEIALLFEDLKHRCKLEIASGGAGKRYIMKNGKWVALPSGFLSAISTPLFTIGDKMRILREPFIKPGSDPDETVAQMVKRRLGNSYLDYAVNPFIAGIYAGDPAKLVTRFALPKLYALEHDYGSFIRGSVAKARLKKSEDEKKATREVFSVEDGLGNMISALADETGREKIITGCESVTVYKVSDGYKVIYEDREGKADEFNAPVVVTTIGGYALPPVLSFISRHTLRIISELEYAKVVQVTAGYKNWTGKPLDAFGGLVPEVEKRNILGVLFPSAIFRRRAPEGGALLSVFLGGMRDPSMIEKDDDEIRDIVLSEIKDTLFCDQEPDLFKVYRYRHAIPQYGKDSGLRLMTIRNIQRDYPGLILAGNIRDGIGMADRVRQAKAIATSLL
jgi:protoporphyrinogen/coproporphyrinogen III oxidase